MFAHKCLSPAAQFAAIVKVCCFAILLALPAGASAATDIIKTGDDYTTTPLSFPTTGTITATQIGDGVWWTPELNETSITVVLDDLNRWHVPNLYLNVFTDGHTLYRSQVFPQRADATDRDWLDYIISRAHEKDVRVHAWVHTLRWQEGKLLDEPSTHPLLAANPGWVEQYAQNHDEREKSYSRYVCPGVPEVRAALTTLVEELCRYEIDGLNIDAAEYDPKMDSGYNARLTHDFRQEAGADPASLRYSSSENSPWMEWVAFREDRLTSLVQAMSSTARANGETSGRRILVSTTVHPEYEDRRGSQRSYQHWSQWIEEKLVDATMPQCFSADLPSLEQQLWEARSLHMGSSVACVPGLALSTGEEENHPSLKEQKRLLRNVGFQHCTVLDYEALRNVMEAADKEPEEKRGFWSFLKESR